MAGVKGKCRQLYLNNNKIIKNKNKETFQARKEWCEIFKVIKSKDLQQTRLLYTAKLLFKIEGENKELPRQGKLKEFGNIKSVMQQMSKSLP